MGERTGLASFIAAHNDDASENIVQDITQLVGWTPVIEIKSITKADNVDARIIAKLESYRPSNSVKDRSALRMIEDTEEKGLIKPGVTTLLEPTDTKIGFKGVLDKVGELSASNPNIYVLNKFSNAGNPGAHYTTTGYEFTEGLFDILWCAEQCLPIFQAQLSRRVRDWNCDDSSGGCTVIFTETKESASELAGLLLGSHALHEDIAQSQHEVILAGFREGKFLVLVAANVAACGLGINDVKLIIQCEACQKNESTSFLRYIMVMKVSDLSTEAWVTAFNDQAEKIIGFTAEELYKIKNEEGENMYQRKLNDVLCVPRLFKINVAQTEYMNEKRQRIIVMSNSIIDHSSESNSLLEETSKSSE